MIAWIINFFKADEQRAFRDGYDYAAGMLLDSGGVNDPRDSICEPETAFDRGIHDACARWQALVGPIYGGRE
jgi:hypothetical protein